MSYLLGLDIGTSGVKGLLLSGDGNIVATAMEEYPFESPRPGWTEQDPKIWWDATVKVTKQITSQAGIKGEEIAGIGLSGQMHSSVFLDNNGEVLRPAILWNDTRTTAQCRQITNLVGQDELLEEACNPALEGFTAPKVLWLKENEPENYAKLRWLVLPKDYIRYKLTGRICMEITDAAGTLLLNVREGAWSKSILSKLDISEDILPEIVQSAEVSGEITTQVGALTGLTAGTPVVGGGADNACGAVGSGAVSEGRSMLSLGTSGVLLAHLLESRLVKEGTVHMFNSSVPQQFYMMGVMLSAGLSYRWFRDEIATGESYTEINEMASQVKAGSRGLLFLPYLTGERTPHGDANARGVFFGLSSVHTRKEMARAVLEGVAFSFRDSVGLMRKAGWPGTSVRAIGGGAKSPLWREIIASVTGLEVQTLNVDEGPAFGAAILAGVGAKVFSSIPEAADSILRVTSSVQPNKNWETVYNEQYEIYQDLYKGLKPSYDKLAQLGNL